MSINKLFLLVGLSTLFVGCSTGMYTGGAIRWEHAGNSAEMGKRYLLGYGAPHDNAKAFYYFNKAAQKGDANAQNELAYMYAAGKGTAQNYPQALYWYQRAAAQGLISAQYNVGLFYLYGLGTPKNKALAITYFRKAAAQGFEPARIALQKNAA